MNSVFLHFHEVPPTPLLGDRGLGLLAVTDDPRASLDLAVLQLRVNLQEVGCVRNQLAQENRIAAVERVDSQAHQLLQVGIDGAPILRVPILAFVLLILLVPRKRP